MEKPPDPTHRPSRLMSLAALLGLFLLAVVLRAWGLDWGLPSPARYYPYHPDEPVLLHAVCSVNPLWGDFAPSFYNYGSLYIILSRLAYDFIAPLAGWGSVPRFDQPFAQWVGDFARLLLVGRWLTVLLGAGTVLLTYLLGAQLFNRRTGALAALFLTLAPMAVLFGHFMTVDVPSAFFTTAALLFAALALRAAETPRAIGFLAAAGLAAGLATGTKYNSFPALLPLLVPLWALWRSGRPAARRDAVLGGTAALFLCGFAFLLSTPGVLLETERFWDNLTYEMARNREGQGLVFRATPPALPYHLFISFPVGLEWPLYLLCLAGGIWAVRRRSPEDALLLLFIVPFFLLLLPAERKFLRYIVPLLPPLLILAARLVDAGSGTRRAALWKGAAGVAAAAALASTVAHLGVLAAPDARTQAAEYLARSASPADLVALGRDPWWYTPPVHPTAGATKVSTLYGGPPVWEAGPDRPRPEVYPLERFRILAPPLNSGALSPAALARHRPRYVVLTDYDYEDSERIRRAEPTYSDDVLQLLAALEKEYEVEQEFRPRPSLAGLTWWSRGIPPHDWRYYMPTVRIYARR